MWGIKKCHTTYNHEAYTLLNCLQKDEVSVTHRINNQKWKKKTDTQSVSTAQFLLGLYIKLGDLASIEIYKYSNAILKKNEMI